MRWLVLELRQARPALRRKTNASRYDVRFSSNFPPKVKIPTVTYHYSGQKVGPLPIKTHPYSILQVPTTQLAKMRIDLKFVELTAGVLKIFYIKY